MKYLYSYECDKLNLSTPIELQAAIDGNRREGRRTSYGAYDNAQRSPNPTQIPSLSLVPQQQQQHHQQIAARMNSVMASTFGLHNGVHHPSHPQPLGHQMNVPSIAGLAPHDLESRMFEYMKLLSKGMTATATATATTTTTTTPSPTLPYANRQSSSPLEQQNEALNLSEPSLKREPECLDSPQPKRFNRDEEEAPKPLAIPSSTHIKINNRGKLHFCKRCHGD